jgi:kinesin family protein 5
MRDKESDHGFTFDHVFQPNCSQEEVYSAVGHEVVEAAFEGFNGTVFAYGQTSSGKTHTCIGPDCSDSSTRGILPRMIGHLFQRIKEEPSYI